MISVPLSESRAPHSERQGPDGPPDPPCLPPGQTGLPVRSRVCDLSCLLLGRPQAGPWPLMWLLENPRPPLWDCGGPSCDDPGGAPPRGVRPAGRQPGSEAQSPTCLRQFRIIHEKHVLRVL